MKKRNLNLKVNFDQQFYRYLVGLVNPHLTVATSTQAHNFFHKNTVRESEAPSLLQKKPRSAKSDVSKVLFPGIGKITNRNAG